MPQPFDSLCLSESHYEVYLHLLLSYQSPCYYKISHCKPQSCYTYRHPVSCHFFSLSLGQHFTLSLFAQNVRFNDHPQAKQQVRSFNSTTAPSGPALPHYRDFMITFRHTTLGRTPLDEWSARHRDFYLTTHNTDNRQIFMPLAGFEPTIPGSKRPRPHALDRAATGTGNKQHI